MEIIFVFIAYPLYMTISNIPGIILCLLIYLDLENSRKARSITITAIFTILVSLLSLFVYILLPTSVINILLLFKILNITCAISVLIIYLIFRSLYKKPKTSGDLNGITAKKAIIALISISLFYFAIITICYTIFGLLVFHNWPKDVIM